MIYTNVCRGLFEAHKLIFSFLIASSIDKQSGKIEEALWSNFLRGAGVVEKSEDLVNPDSTILSEITWEFTQYVSNTYA